MSQYQPRHDPRRQQPTTPPQFRQYGQQPQSQQSPYQQWQPPKRRSWVRRHKFLTFFSVFGFLLVGVGLLASLHRQPGIAAAPAGLAACTSHHAVTDRQWLEITKDPAAAEGQCIIVYGEVTQFDSVTGDSAFRAQAGGVKGATTFGVAAYPTNTLFEGDAKTLGALVEHDLFTAQVTIAGAKSYDTTLGGSTTAPLLRVDSVTRTGHLGT